MKCKVESCDQQTAGQSKYCREHRVESRKRFKEMLAQQAVDHAERDNKFKELWKQACKAGYAAALTANQQIITAMDEMTGQVFEPFPICGFAWITIRPGNCAFANWLKKNNYGKTNSYSGGVQIWISDYNQSYDRKLAHAKAVEKVLVAAGIKAYADGRLD